MTGCQWKMWKETMPYFTTDAWHYQLSMNWKMKFSQFQCKNAQIISPKFLNATFFICTMCFPFFADARTTFYWGPCSKLVQPAVIYVDMIWQLWQGYSSICPAWRLLASTHRPSGKAVGSKPNGWNLEIQLLVPLVGGLLPWIDLEKIRPTSICFKTMQKPYSFGGFKPQSSWRDFDA